MLTGNIGGKAAALLILSKIKAFRKRLDYTEVGGGIMIGVQHPVIKAHGSSNGKAFFNAIRQAKKCVDEDITGEIARALK
jgi:glycerol-3-phosphate acyltransferase PlsX